jgi:hypothetical protein
VIIFNRTSICYSRIISLLNHAELFLSFCLISSPPTARMSQRNQQGRVTPTGHLADPIILQPYGQPPGTPPPVQIQPHQFMSPPPTMVQVMPIMETPGGPVYATAQPVTQQPIYVTAQAASPEPNHASSQRDPLRSETILGIHSLFIKQKRNGHRMCCFARSEKSEFLLAPAENVRDDLFYANQTRSNCSICCPSFIQPFEVTLHRGATDRDAVAVRYYRPLSCPPCVCKCCCSQQVTAINTLGTPLGHVKESFYCCVPSYNVLTPDNTVQYKLQVPTCFGGLCVDYCAEGDCTLSPSFYIYEVRENDKEKHVGKFKKICRDLSPDLLAKNEILGAYLPENADPGARARLLGAAFLFNFLYYKSWS